MNIFSSKKEHKKEHKMSSTDASSAPTQEVKYERVETADVDKAGNAVVTDVREGVGKDDPALNFTPHPPGAIVPGAQSGMAPGAVAPPVSISSDLRSAEERSISSSSRSDISDLNRGGEFVRESESTRVRDLRGPTNMEGMREGSVRSSQSSSRVESNEAFASSASMQRSAPMGVQREILVSGTGTGKVEEHHEHEVIKHSSGTRQRVEEVISVPVTRFESTNMESIREGATYTTDKPLTIPAPQLAPPITPAKMEIHLGGASAEVHANTNFELTDTEIAQLGPEEYERYRQKVEKLTRMHEFETAQKAAEYRAEVERDAELIRRTLERQHIRDIDFRKEMIEAGIERQEREIQLEAEYAMRVLEKEREAARAALERAKAESNIEVNIDSAVGTTHSVGHMTTSSERQSSEVQGSATRVNADIRPARV